MGKITFTPAEMTELKAIEVDSDKLVDLVIEQEVTGAFAAVERPLLEAFGHALLQAGYDLLNKELAVSPAS